MKSSDTIGELAKALSKAQSVMTSAAKDRDNPFFSSTYATLESVISTIRKPFADHGLSFTQLPGITADGLVSVETVLMHASGEWVASSIADKPVKPGPQATGSVISYLKRYALQAMAGIASAEDDDDGEAAQGRANSPAAARAASKAEHQATGVQPAALAQKVAMALKWFGDHGWPTARVLDSIKRASPADITDADLGELRKISETIAKGD